MQTTSNVGEFVTPAKVSLSIIIPTFNESQNILGLLQSVEENLPPTIATEVIVVDDNSPDGTGKVVEEYAKSRHDEKKGKYHLRVIHRPLKSGLSSAILTGVQEAVGEIVVVMDSDLSHPPQTIPKMVEEIHNSNYDIVVASRYIFGGAIHGWPFKRKLASKGATKIAQYGLGIEIKDPMSGFFAFKRHIIKNVQFDAIGYKVLLEMLVKTKGVKIKEIPYIFTNRTFGSSKLDAGIVYDYMRAVWKLYRYGKSLQEKESRTSIRFLSKAGRFYTVGASGLLVNYVISLLFTVVLSSLWYIHATIIGIVFSITSNFILNKVWTFEDRNFSKYTLVQYGMFLGFSALGAIVQLSLIYLFVESYGISYSVALVLAVAAASLGNFLLNKKWTFKERIWS